MDLTGGVTKWSMDPNIVVGSHNLPAAPTGYIGNYQPIGYADTAFPNYTGMVTEAQYNAGNIATPGRFQPLYSKANMFQPDPHYSAENTQLPWWLTGGATANASGSANAIANATATANPTITVNVPDRPANLSGLAGLAKVDPPFVAPAQAPRFSQFPQQPAMQQPQFGSPPSQAVAPVPQRLAAYQMQQPGQFPGPQPMRENPEQRMRPGIQPPSQQQVQQGQLGGSAPQLFGGAQRNAPAQAPPMPQMNMQQLMQMMQRQRPQAISPLSMQPPMGVRPPSRPMPGAGMPMSFAMGQASAPLAYKANDKATRAGLPPGGDSVFRGGELIGKEDVPSESPKDEFHRLQGLVNDLDAEFKAGIKDSGRKAENRREREEAYNRLKVLLPVVHPEIFEDEPGERLPDQVWRDMAPMPRQDRSTAAPEPQRIGKQWAPSATGSPAPNSSGPPNSPWAPVRTTPAPGPNSGALPPVAPKPMLSDPDTFPKPDLPGGYQQGTADNSRPDMGSERQRQNINRQQGLYDQRQADAKKYDRQIKELEATGPAKPPESLRRSALFNDTARAQYNAMLKDSQAAYNSKLTSLEQARDRAMTGSTTVADAMAVEQGRADREYMGAEKPPTASEIREWQNYIATQAGGDVSKMPKLIQNAPPSVRPYLEGMTNAEYPGAAMAAEKKQLDIEGKELSNQLAAAVNPEKVKIAKFNGELAALRTKAGIAQTRVESEQVRGQILKKQAEIVSVQADVFRRFGMTDAANRSEKLVADLNNSKLLPVYRQAMFDEFVVREYDSLSIAQANAVGSTSKAKLQAVLSAVGSDEVEAARGRIGAARQQMVAPPAATAPTPAMTPEGQKGAYQFAADYLKANPKTPMSEIDKELKAQGYPAFGELSKLYGVKAAPKGFHLPK